MSLLRCSAALAASEASGSSGVDLLTSIVLGCEIMQALSDAANPGLREDVESLLQALRKAKRPPEEAEQDATTSPTLASVANGDES